MKPAAPEMTYLTSFHATKWSRFTYATASFGQASPARANPSLAFSFCRAISEGRGTDQERPSGCGLQIGSLGHRIWKFFWEVLCQAKVIRERPLPGAAHAFVFWGFCAFALVTLNHIAAGFGFPFLDRHGLFGGFYFWFAFAFAALCAISIAYLAFRRFVLRPKWLGPVSYESGLIALFIFILMVTYIAGWWVPEASATGQVLWWMHALTLLAFLPLIPHTKHLHLVLSPLTIFLERDEFSDDSAALGRRGLRSRYRQGHYTDHCAAGLLLRRVRTLHRALPGEQHRQGTESETDRARTAYYLNEFGPADEKPILEATVSQTAIFQCTTCGACEYQCPVGIQHLPMIVGSAARRGKYRQAGKTNTAPSSS